MEKMLGDEFDSFCDSYNRPPSISIRINTLKLTPKEYKELISALLNSPNSKFKEVEVPNWVQNNDDWFIWKQEFKLGIPILQNMELHLEGKKWDKLKNIAKEIGDEDSFLKYYEKSHEAIEKYIELTEPYFDEYHRKNKIGKYSEPDK